MTSWYRKLLFSILGRGHADLDPIPHFTGEGSGTGCILPILGQGRKPVRQQVGWISSWNRASVVKRITRPRAEATCWGEENTVDVF
jgi:hypothetical protein